MKMKNEKIFLFETKILLQMETFIFEEIEYKGRWFEEEYKEIKCWFFKFSGLTFTHVHRNHFLFEGRAKQIFNTKNISPEDMIISGNGVFIFGFYSLEKGNYTPLSCFSEFKPVKR